jgi:hypothetical protein
MEFCDTLYIGTQRRIHQPLLLFPLRRDKAKDIRLWGISLVRAMHRWPYSATWCGGLVPMRAFSRLRLLLP